MSEDAPELPPGTVLAGRFRVVRCLGMGGMGAVYEIEHELTKHRRALKLLHAEMAENKGVVERFLREASAAGRVGNPHIIETFDAGTLDGGEPYLVMEFLSGATLADRIEKGTIPIPDVIDLVSQACEGVEAAHQAGIVHRDLKPENLYVTTEKGKPFVKILDFGISKFDPGKTGGLALTQEGAALGTPYYMSPEQIRGETTLDARTDVYALGVILYECLTGRRPFDADTITHLAVLIHAGNAEPPSKFRPDMPPGLDAVIARAMHTSASERTPSAAALQAELKKYEGLAFDQTSAEGIVVPRAQLGGLTVAAQSLASSAGGVSIATEQPSPASKKKSGLGVGIAIAAVAGIAAFVLRPGSSDPNAEPQPAKAVAATATPVVVSSGSALPGAVVTPTLAPPVPAAPTPSATAVEPPVSKPPVSANNPAPAAPLPKSRKGRETGLAQDNPFR